MATFFDYETGEQIEGEFDGAIADASMADETGGVYAALIGERWELVDPSQVSTLQMCGTDVRAVYALV